MCGASYQKKVDWTPGGRHIDPLVERALLPKPVDCSAGSLVWSWKGSVMLPSDFPSDLPVMAPPCYSATFRLPRHFNESILPFLTGVSLHYLF